MFIRSYEFQDRLPGDGSHEAAGVVHSVHLVAGAAVAPGVGRHGWRRPVRRPGWPPFLGRSCVLLPSEIKRINDKIRVSIDDICKCIWRAYLLEIVKMPEVDVEVAITGLLVNVTSFKSHQSIQCGALVGPCRLTDHNARQIGQCSAMWSRHFKTSPYLY